MTLKMKLLGSLFIVIVQALATSCTQSRINFTASLEHKTSSSALLQIRLQCGLQSVNTSERDSVSPLLGGTHGHIKVHHSDSDLHSGQFYIVVDELSTITNLTNYTTSVHENGNITVTFYIPRREKFVGKFSCGYNTSNLTLSLSNHTTELVFAYMPEEIYLFDGNAFAFLFSLFCSLFVVALVLLVISITCLCYCVRRRRLTKTPGPTRNNWMHGGSEAGMVPRYPSSSAVCRVYPQVSSGKYVKESEVYAPHDHEKSVKELQDAPFSFKTLSSSSSEPLAVDEFLKILSHPSPCLSSGCSCSYYKQKLLFDLRQTAMQTRTQRLYPHLAPSELEMELSKSMRMNSPVNPQFAADCGEDHSHQPPVECVQLTSQAAETDHGYASIGSISSVLHPEMHLQQERKLAQSKCEPSVIKAQPLVKVKGFHAVTVESDTTQISHAGASADTQCDNIFRADHPAPKFQGEAVLPAHTHGHLSRDCCDISYPTLYPDTGEELEVMGLSDKFNLDANFIDPIETVHFDCNGGRYANENHEVYLRIPRGAIPEGKTISIEVGVSFHSALVSLLPLESKPVSPLLKLCVVREPNFRFLKPVEVTLPHFLDIADEEDPDQMGLQFLKSGHSLYCFHQSDGVATFKPRVNTATLKTTHFCTFCIAANKNISDKKINYRLVKVVPKNKAQKEWRANFCVTYYLRTCLQALKKQFPDLEYEIKTLRKFRFGELAELEIQFERKLAGGWQMALETSNKIIPEAVKYWDLDPDELAMMEDDKVYPPRFEVLVCGSHARELITALICFRGIAELGNDTTELVLEPMAAGPLIGTAAVSMRQPPHHLGIGKSTSSPAISQNTRLPPYRYQHEGESETKRSSPSVRRSFPMANGPAQSDLMNYVAAALPSKWRLVGVQLGLSWTSLEEIEKNHPDDCKRCFSAVFREWEHQNTSPYCWTTVVHALHAPSVEENRVAEDVRTHFMHDTWSLSSYQSSTGSSSGYCTETVTQV